MSLVEKVERAKTDYDEVYEAGIEEGKQADYDQFWDAFQGGGAATYYVYRFAGQGWNDTSFKPKYDIKPVGNANGMFRDSTITNMRAIFLSCGITLDMSKSTGNNATFGYTKNTLLPKLDFSSATLLQSTFSSSSQLVEIEEMVVHEKLQYASTFSGCTALEHLIVTGTIGQNGFDVSACPLSRDSLISIINALMSGASKTITLGTTNLAKLTDAEKAIATQKGWTLL